MLLIFVAVRAYAEPTTRVLIYAAGGAGAIDHLRLLPFASSTLLRCSFAASALLHCRLVFVVVCVHAALEALHAPP